MTETFDALCNLGYVTESLPKNPQKTPKHIPHQTDKTKNVTLNWIQVLFPRHLAGSQPGPTTHTHTQAHERATLLASANPMLTQFKQAVGPVWQQPESRITVVMSCAPPGGRVTQLFAIVVNFWFSQLVLLLVQQFGRRVILQQPIRHRKTFAAQTLT